MGLFDRFSNKSNVNDLVNVDVKKPAGSKLITRITQSNLTRSKQDIGRWRDALSQAESKYYPDRLNLYRVYQEVVLDAHLSAVIQQRHNKVLSHGFKVLDANGEFDEEKTKLLKTKWFNDFVKYNMQAVDYGFSLVEFGSIVNDEFDELRLVPREYVCSEKDSFKTSLNGSELIKYNIPPFDKWTLFLGDKEDLGLLNKATPLILWKRLVQATWAEFNELFGIPMRIGKTNTKDTEARNNMENMLRNLGSSAWGLFDEDDNIQILNGVVSNGYETFKEFIDQIDAQISKLYLGQTMTTDNGSSRSQSEVHENTLYSFTGADLRNLSYSINKKLFPFLTMKGLGFEGYSFEWDLDEKLSLTEQFAIDKELLNYYAIPAEYITKTYGTPVEEKEAIAPMTPSNGVTIMNDVASLYKDFFKHGEGCSCGNC